MNKNLIIITICILSNFYTIAQSNFNKVSLIELGVKDSVYSNILKENRNIWIQIPESANRVTNHPQKYPVVYVLDGKVHFMSICAIINQLSPGNIPEMIVVGIENVKNRTRDLTPTNVKEARGASEWVKDSGGGEKFTRFLKEELIPYVDNNYPTASNRTLIGHSFGGLLAVNVLINHPKLFKNYIALDPSLWWDDECLTSGILEKLSNKKYNGKSLFLSISNPMPPGKEKNITKLATSNIIEVEGLKAVYRFSKLVSESKNSQLNFRYKYYENEDHGTIPLVSSYDGMKFLFSWYKMNGEFVDVIKNPNSTSKDLLNSFTKRFETLSNYLGYQVHPEEDLLNNLGYMFMTNAPQKSLTFFNMAIKYYPKNANVYDSISDYYESQNDIKKAIEFCEKAYAISDSKYYKEKLDRLKNK